MNTRSTELKDQLKRRGGIDPAALGAASLASAISTIVQPGPYTPLTSIVGLTILFLILAYDIEASRTKFQSLAYSAVAAMTSVLASGYPCELAFGFMGFSYAESAWLCVAVWGIFFALYYWRDKRARKR